ncbi:uncharacterized protein LOC115581221 [Sparus aurata]|uniref:uncharacterized protein LOC115581221 n=1 Tax=Sparus aurata TaxID=8175 RepID=UPI0011C18AA4|nr:uncharacterized protein LOC115581221 [Sparus aurata]
MNPQGALLKDLYVYMKAGKHVGHEMNERRKDQAECGADKSVYVHSKQWRNFQSRRFHENTVFSLPPLRPQPYGDKGLYFGGSELLGLQVQGFCCPLQQRPSTGRITHGMTPLSRGGGDGSLTLLSSLKERLESRVKPASRSRNGNRPEKTLEDGASTVSHHRDPVRETAETPCNKERQAHQGQPGTTKVSELHLYLPSSLCDDEEQDTGTEEKRTTAEETSTQGSLVKPKSTKHPNPSHTSQDQPNSGPDNTQHTF